MAYLVLHAPAQLPAWLGMRPLDLENLLRPLLDRHAAEGCRQARVGSAEGRCPLGPAWLETPRGERVCRVHPVPGDADPEKATAERERMLDETMVRLFAAARTLGELHVAWAPGQGAPVRHAVVAADADPAAAELVIELLDRVSAPLAPGVPGDWARAAPHDRVRGLEKKGAGLELALVPPNPGAEISLKIRTLRVPESLYLRLEEGKYHLELRYADGEAREEVRRSLADMTTLTGVASYAEGFFSDKTSMILRWIHSALRGSRAEIVGEAVVLTGSAQIQPQDWQKTIVTARRWMTRQEPASREDREECEEQRSALALAGEMWQLERDTAPPPELARLVELGMLRTVPACPAGGQLSLDIALRVSCSIHGPELPVSR